MRFQLLAGEVAQGARDLVLAGVTAMHIDHRGADAAVPHAIHQLTQSRPGARRKNVPGMPQVVKVHTRQPGNTSRNLSRM